MKLLPYQRVKDKIVSLRGQDVILDFAVAELYGVETREINQAVKNNPDKFPEGYVWEIDKQELIDLQSKFLFTNGRPLRRGHANEQNGDGNRTQLRRPEIKAHHQTQG